MLRIFFSDYNLIQRWSTELIYFENSPCVDTEIHSSHMGDIVNVLVSSRGEINTPLADITRDTAFSMRIIWFESPVRYDTLKFKSIKSETQ